MRALHPKAFGSKFRMVVAFYIRFQGIQSDRFLKYHERQFLGTGQET